MDVRLEAQSPKWESFDSTALIAESRGAILAVRVDSGRVIVTVNREDNSPAKKEDIEKVRRLMQARGLNIIEQTV